MCLACASTSSQQVPYSNCFGVGKDIGVTIDILGEVSFLLFAVASGASATDKFGATRGSSMLSHFDERDLFIGINHPSLTSICPC